MKKRLRKKLGKGEFRQTGYIHVDAEFREDLSPGYSRTVYGKWKKFLASLSLRGYGIWRGVGFCNAMYGTVQSPLPEDLASTLDAWLSIQKEISWYQVDAAEKIDSPPEHPPGKRRLRKMTEEFTRIFLDEEEEESGPEKDDEDQQGGKRL